MPSKPQYSNDLSIEGYTKISANLFYDHFNVCNWIVEHCTGKYHLYNNCIFFEKEADAVIFKLGWK